MIAKFLVVLFTTIVLQGRAQAPNFKCDSLQMSESGQFAIVYIGAKQGLLNTKSGDFEWPMSKSPIFYFGIFSEHEIFIRYSENEIQSRCFTDAGVLTQINSPKDSMIFSLPGMMSDDSEAGKVAVNNFRYSWKNGAFEEIDHLFSIRGLQRGIVRDSPTRLIISHFNLTDNLVYGDDTVISNEAIALSGLYDLETKTWIIPRKYLEIQNVNGYYFCSRVSEQRLGNNYLLANYQYDVYSAKGLLVQSGMQKLDERFVTGVLGMDSVEFASDSIHVVTMKEGKQGLIRFHLLDRSSTEFLDFRYQVLLPPVHDFVQLSRTLDLVITYDSMAVLPITLYDFRAASQWGLRHDCLDSITSAKNSIIALSSDYLSQIVLADERRYRYLKLEPVGFVMQDEGIPLNPEDASDIFSTWWYDRPTLTFGIGQVLQDKLVLTSLIRSSTLNAGEPIWDENDGTTHYVDYLGNEILPNYTPAVQRCGVYDLSLKKWAVEPRFSNVQLGYDGMLLQELFAGENGENEHAVYTVQNNDGRIIADNLTIEQVLADTGFFRHITPTTVRVDSFFCSPSAERTRLKNRGDFYYYTAGDKIGICKLSNGISLVDAKVVAEPFEFVHYSEAGNFMFALTIDKLWFINPDTMLSVGRDKTLSFLYGLRNSDVFTGEVLKMNVGDSTEIIYQNGIENNELRSWKASVQLIDGKYLVLNDSRQISEYGYYFDEIWGNEYETRLSMEAEASSVWEWQDTRWIKATPYYAGVIPVPCGYITRTGFFHEDGLDFSSRGSDQPPTPTVMNTPSRYFLLDKNFAALFFGDWLDFDLVEDLGFGIAIWMNGNAAFIDYTGKAVTDAEWDRFEMEDGKLKAIRNLLYRFDEIGNVMLDENGNEIILREATEKYFFLRE